MPRSGGIFGDGGIGRRFLEAAAQRGLGVDLHEQEGLRARLVEAVGDLRMLDVAHRSLGRIALNQLGTEGTRGQDDETDGRLALARRVRYVSRRDSHLLYAGRLRNAFCFGTGVVTPRAVDEEVQLILQGFWDARTNLAELTSPSAQWRSGKDLWENSNLYYVVFDDGKDGRVLLGSLQHDQVVDVVRDPEVWRRVLWYVVKEYVYEWDFEKHAPKPRPRVRTVYYESFDGMAELEEDMLDGRPVPPQSPPPYLVRPGRVLHVAINRGKEQAFGEPEMRSAIRWAAAFNDILAGQTEKAKAAQSYLMKVRAKGARTADQLQALAMNAVGRRSNLVNSPLTAELDVDATPPHGAQAGGVGGRHAPPGSQFWENDTMEAEPFNLDSGGQNAKADLENASQAFAAGTNYPGHYFFGDPGSLAGSMAVELPVLKLTEVDQKLWEIDVFTRLCDHAIQRAIDVGLLTPRRKPTDEELAAGVEPEEDGMVERNLTYEVTLPDPLRRNLPELMSLVVDTVTAFDPTGQNKPMKRALVGYVLELLDVSDAAELLERIMHADEQIEEELAAQAEQQAAMDKEAHDAALAAVGDPNHIGPDGKQHPPGNAYGAKQKSAVVEAAVGQLWEMLAEAVERGEDPRALIGAGSNGSG